MKYIDLYYKLEKLGRLEGPYGLCCDLAANELPSYVRVHEVFGSENPTDENYTNNRYGGPEGEFTDLRKNMLLLLAAMEGEI